MGIHHALGWTGSEYARCIEKSQHLWFLLFSHAGTQTSSRAEKARGVPRYVTTHGRLLIPGEEEVGVGCHQGVERSSEWKGLEGKLRSPDRVSYPLSLDHAISLGLSSKHF